MQEDTDKLLQDAAEGATDAVDALFSRHRSRLRGMITARLDERLVARVDPSDVVQETLAVAYWRLEKYLSERPISFYPWLRQIAVNRLIDLHRRHLQAGKRTVEAEAMSLPISEEALSDLSARFVAQVASPPQQVDESERRQLVRKMLATMDGSDREILILRSVEQLSVVETAESLGIAVGTAKSRHFRALLRLREQLTQNGLDFP